MGEREAICDAHERGGKKQKEGREPIGGNRERAKEKEKPLHR